MQPLPHRLGRARRHGRRLAIRLGVPVFPGDTLVYTGEVTGVDHGGPGGRGRGGLPGRHPARGPRHRHGHCTLPLSGDIRRPRPPGRRRRQTEAMTDWTAVTRRNARSVQTTVGWIFWDPGAVARYRAEGLPEGSPGPSATSPPGAPRWPRPARRPSPPPSAPSARSGSPPSSTCSTPTASPRMWAGPGRGGGRGAGRPRPGHRRPAGRARSRPVGRWSTRCPWSGGCSSAPTCAAPARPIPLLSGWHAVNCLREWRGDTHWALVVAAGLTHAEASILHNAWLGLRGGLVAPLPGDHAGGPRRRMAGTRAAKGLAAAGRSPPTGVALRQRIEDDTDRLTTLPWELLGERVPPSSPNGSSRRASCCWPGWTRRPGPTTSPRRGCGCRPDVAPAGTGDRGHPGHRPGHGPGPGRRGLGRGGDRADGPRGEGRDDSDTGAGRPLPGSLEETGEAVRAAGRRSPRMVADLHDHDALRAAVTGSRPRGVGSTCWSTTPSTPRPAAWSHPRPRRRPARGQAGRQRRGPLRPDPGGAARDAGPGAAPSST